MIAEATRTPASAAIGRRRPRRATTKIIAAADPTRVPAMHPIAAPTMPPEWTPIAPPASAATASMKLNAVIERVRCTSSAVWSPVWTRKARAAPAITRAAG